MKNNYILAVLLLIGLQPVIAQNVLINNGASWKYYDTGNEPSNISGYDWTETPYNDGSWSSGNAQLGYGDNDESTVISSATISGYFRHEFNVSNPGQFAGLSLDLTYDDGAVIYLNGSEVWRVNMPSGNINYNTFSSTTSSDNALASTNIANTLVSGTNVIAVEIHQRSNSSSDLSFDLKLEGSIPGQVKVERGPYLQSGTPTSIIVRWRTASPTESIIDYGTTQGNLNQTVSNSSLKTEHELQISGLSPNTVYYYQISNSSQVLVSAANDVYFKTAPVAGTSQPITAWILGDCGTANNNARAVRDAYYGYIGNSHTDMMLFLGDNAYNSGTDNEYQAAIFENMYEDKLKNTVAWSCLGNHDGYTANSNSQTGPYYDIFSFPTNGEAGGVASGTEAYYSFDYGNIHFIVLESYETDRSVGGAMYNWAQNDIQNTTQDWIVAFWHHPAYTKGSHDSDSESNLIQMRENFLPMLEDGGVDLVLAGHSHSYERSYFLNGHYGNSNSFSSSTHTVGANGAGDGRTDGNGAYEKDPTGPNPSDGAVYITAGSSGKVSSGSLDHEAMFYSISALGSCILEVDGVQMNLKFLRENGSIYDYFTIDKSTACVVNDPCDDGDPNTINDVYDANCDCAGVINCTAGDLCDDGNPNTINDVYDVNCDCAGVLFCTPGTACDDGNPDTVNDIYDANCDCSGTSVLPVEVCAQISSGADDVEERESDGNMYSNSSDLELVFDTYNSQGNQTVGLRFNNNDIPQGANIAEAYIQFTADETSSGTANLTISGEATNNAAAFTTAAFNVSSRPSTTANVAWSPNAWSSIGQAGADQRTPDLSAIIQEIVDRPGFTRNNSIVIKITGTGKRTAESYSGSASNAATLCVSYTETPPCTTVGQACDDGDPCTVGETYDANCNCSGGTLADADNDGVCDLNDQCPGTDDALIGMACDDGDPCTVGEVYDANCNCSGGTLADADNDGVCDLNDQCPGTDDALIGTACDDGDPCTVGEVYDANCNCSGGTFADSDGDGVCDTNDVCPGTDDALIGMACDDGNPCTVGEVYDANCNCSGGTFADSDGDGVCDANDVCPGTDDALIGMACDDGDACTIGDSYDNNCNCTGTLIDSDNDGVCDADDQCPGTDDALIGTTCDDGDPCTVGEVYDANCNCSGGTFADSDGDGVCDANDVCPGTDDALIGMACDDGDACTIGDSYDNNCNCTGTLIDSDNDGVCDADDQCPGTDDALIGTTCDDGDPCTVGEVYDANCNCSGGTFADSDGDGVCDANDACPGTDDALIGTACDDGDACTTGETYDANCNCSGGVFQDADSDGVCDSEDQCPGIDDNLVGMACDDGDACTVGETYDGNCNCTGGTFMDSDGDGVCDAEDVCPGGDDTIDNDNNGVPDACDISCSYAVIDFNNFDASWGIWNDGGSDCRRSNKDASYAYSGSRCVRIRDNTSTSVMTTDDLDLSNYEELTISFTYITSSMDNSNEDFWLQVSTDGGTSYQTVEEWNQGDEFVNDVREFESVVITGSFSANTRLRFRCDASGNGDKVYLDDVEISGCLSVSSLRSLPEPVEAEPLFENIDFTPLSKTKPLNVKLYPNPFQTSFQVQLDGYDQTHPVEVDIMSVDGKVLYHQTYRNNTFEITDINLNSGLYFIILTHKGHASVQKILKM